MKKIFLILFLGLFVLCGCSKYNESSIKNDLNKKIKGIKGYHLTGKLDIFNGDNTYKYDVESSKYKDNYRVSLINKSNNHELVELEKLTKVTEQLDLECKNLEKIMIIPTSEKINNKHLSDEMLIEYFD